MNQSKDVGMVIARRSHARASHKSDVTLTQVMNEYLEGLEAGRPADRADLLRRYPELADELAECLDGIDFIHQVAPQLGDAAPDGERSDSSAERPPAAALGDYRIIREIGRGGMGVVYEAEQMSMRRRVALKVLPFAAVMDQRQIARFKNEAQAAGLLQHTNIVPVYGVGCERGVHYYAMQYIEGRTLAEIIEQMRKSACGAPVPPAGKAPVPPADQAGGTPAPQFWAGGGSGLDPTIDSDASADRSEQATDQFDLSVASMSPKKSHLETSPIAALSTERLVNKCEYNRTIAKLGIQAAEALDHAHKNGILHRDVKPGNLMLDNGGNLWVTDFGLARMEGNAQMTISGDLVGTLRYMSPEQALAKRVIVDQRTDIYSLGVTLYELLTLRPAFEGTDRQELLRQIAFEDPPRLSDKSIPPDLETIVFKAMAKNPLDRYATAQDMADDVDRFLREEPIQAKRPTLLQRVRRWSKRHRPAVTATAMVLGITFVLLIAGWRWQAYQNRLRLSVIYGQVTRAFEEAAQWRGQAEAAPDDLPRWTRALDAAKRAESLLPIGADDELANQVRALLATLTITERQATQRVAQREADRQLIRDLEQVRLEKADYIGLTVNYSEIDSRYATALLAYGIDLDSLNAEESLERVAEFSAKSALAALMDDWAIVRRRAQGQGHDGWKKLLAIARSIDSNEVRNTIRDALEREDQQMFLKLASSEEAPRLPSPTIVVLSAAMDAAGNQKAAEYLLLRASEAQPGDFWIHFALTQVLSHARPADYHAMLRSSQVALALRPDSATVIYAYAEALFNIGELDACIRASERAINIRRDDAYPHCVLSAALAEKGEFDQAIAESREAIRLKPDLAVAYANLGAALHESGMVAEGIKELREAIRLDPDLALAHNGLGNALNAMGEFDEAIEAYREAIRLEPYLGEAYGNLGSALFEKGRIDEGFTALRQAVRLMPNAPNLHWILGKALSKVPGKNALGEAISEFREAIRLMPVRVEDNAKVQYDLGTALAQNGSRDEAIDVFRQAIRLKPNFAEAYNNLGNALSARGDLDGAIEAYRRTLELRPDLAEPHNNLGVALKACGDLEGAMAAYRRALELKPDYAEVHANIGEALSGRNDLDGAMAAYRQALELKPDFAGAHNSIGNALSDRGDLEGAVTAYRRALKLEPDYADAHYNLGNALSDQGDLAGAIAAYRRALELKPDLADAHLNLGNALKDRGDLEGAITEYRRALELKPDHAKAHNNLGVALLDRGDLDGAMAEYRRALELKPDNANVHNNLGIALITRRDLDGAIAAYRRALELEPDYPEAHNNLGNALCNRGDLDGAVAAYRRALELRPDYANAHNNLGVALSERGDLVGAIAEFRRAVELRPDAGPHANLGDALKARGDLVGALAEYRRALELKPDWTALAQELRRCERLVELDGRLEAILRGEAKSGNPAETIEFALLCLMYKHRNAAAARLFTQAFADEPDLARDMNAQHRYNAVCAAVLSSSGQGNDATSLDDTECARLRQQALDWLRADLTAWIDQLGRASRDPNAESAAKLRAAVLRTLLHWQKDPDLANVRNAEALAHLPDAEREAWGKLWAEVANVVNSAAESR